MNKSCFEVEMNAARKKFKLRKMIEFRQHCIGIEMTNAKHAGLPNTKITATVLIQVRKILKYNTNIIMECFSLR